MRHHIEHLSTREMPWREISPGVFIKMLNHNKETGHRTGLFRFVPEEGAAPPSISHYHSISEELFILEGKMTFDNETWLSKYAYIYHPPFLVHGFNSSVPVETTFIGRADNDLDFNYPDKNSATQPYYFLGEPAARGLAYLNLKPEDQWKPLLNPAGKEIGLQNILSQDPLTQAGSSLIKFHKGVEVPARPKGYEICNEGYILKGRVEALDGTVWARGDYWYRHPGNAVPALKVTEDTLVFSSVAPPD